MICKLLLVCIGYLGSWQPVQYTPQPTRTPVPIPTLTPQPTVTPYIVPTVDYSGLDVPTIEGYSTGYWSEYADGVMDIVINNRIEFGQVPVNIRDVYGDRFIAVYWYEDAYREYTVCFDSSGLCEVVYAIDFHNPEMAHLDKPFFLDGNIIGELSYSMARRNGVEANRHGSITER